LASDDEAASLWSACACRTGAGIQLIMALTCDASITLLFRRVHKHCVDDDDDDRPHVIIATVAPLDRKTFCPPDTCPDPTIHRVRYLPAADLTIYM